MNFSRDGLSEGGAVAFQATFSDGSQGVYTIDVPPPGAELRITAVSLSVNALRFSFPASSGQSYVIESRADLASGEWAEVPGTTQAGAGASLEVSLPIRASEPQQFYRVRQLP